MSLPHPFVNLPTRGYFDYQNGIHVDAGKYYSPTAYSQAIISNAIGQHFYVTSRDSVNTISDSLLRGRIKRIQIFCGLLRVQWCHYNLIAPDSILRMVSMPSSAWESIALLPFLYVRAFTKNIFALGMSFTIRLSSPISTHNC